ncbi:EscU/YscU/HrcU family type III secretion system export apparatus switch protein [Glaciecola sp. 1036]|uniref:EscU/YscU/HrcU family type III secretion system export apparatus switch protein n=1 Tax=Alteromonadaceae TaxID=72275 RepID=UPI003D060617
MDTYDKHSLHKSKAVGLKYDGAKSSPKVIAKGEGQIADEILAIAQAHGILVHEDEELMQVLSQLDLGQEIPEALYLVIAELIAFSYLLQGKFPENWRNLHNKVDFNV